MTATAHFSIGDVVYHTRLNYRGVVYDIDPKFMLSEEWYRNVATSRPPKDKPWYHVLVHNSTHETYVAERHLEADSSHEPINHPLTDDLFATFQGDRYTIKGKSN